ncbi:helix-turn-helix domain-containing protein [Ruminococcus gauvreauii]|uniref:helix-turn-helix domain-containing protein n=1 Tax=Ruminococcus gauvreauii TaxID=438033 RepID=UPI003983E5E2
MQEIREQNFQTYNDTSSVIICKFHHEFQAKEVPLHSHEEYCELVYLQKGKAALSIGGQSIQAQSGALIFLEKAVAHEGSYQALERCGKTERYVLKLRNTDRLLPPEYHPVISLDTPRILTSLFQLIEREYLSREAGWELICTNTLETLFQLIRRNAQPVQSIPESSTRVQQLADDIIAYIHTHYCEKISLQSVADNFYISPYYLSHLLKDQRNISMMQYVIQLRISEAQMLLRDTDYSVRQIAKMTGYQNFNYFLNVFKKKTGTTPNAYRSRHY